ncbi:probable serine/threonine-protein kinase dyrk2 [Lucilia cuprina]|uniref:probable serine/threonine-protein kinase dyrk2 n=1 Tax=Lucilia cuprina TaxID=7375 RepID=UPI000C71B508|nr:probable serine/threonine-protein kinase dyrk2 [Lucilia cuprina]
MSFKKLYTLPPKAPASNMFSFTKNIKNESSLECTFVHNFCSPSTFTISDISSLQTISNNVNLSPIISKYIVCQSKYFKSSSSAIPGTFENLSSVISTPIVSDSKLSLERTYSANISSSYSSCTAALDVKNVGENLSSVASTLVISDSKFSPDRTYCENISSSSSFNKARRDVKRAGEYVSSAVQAPVISDCKFSPEHTYCKNISSSSSSYKATPGASPNNITSVKVINSVNNIDDNLSSAESTPTVSDSKFSVERTYSDNISSSSSSNAATPDAKNFCENSSSEVSTPIVSASKCSLNRTFSDNVST